MMEREEESVILRRKVVGDRNGNKRLSWSISDLSALPIVKTNSIVKPKYHRVRNASISSCSLSSASSNFSLRSNGSFRRKARIPVTGFTERAFLANEVKMRSDAEIIVNEDLEYLAKVDNEDNDPDNRDAEKDTPAERDLNHQTNKQETMKNCSKELVTKDPDEKAALFVEQVKETISPVEARERMMSVSSVASRDSMSSVSSFSSSFVIDRIFHWRKSSTKSMKSPDAESRKSGHFNRLSEPWIRKVTKDNSIDQDEQIDNIAARSLAGYNSVNEGSKFYSPSSNSLPEKPVKFHIKQLELLLAGHISPPSHIDPSSVQIRLDSLRVLESLNNINCNNKISSDNVYDVPRCL